MTSFSAACALAAAVLFSPAAFSAPPTIESQISGTCPSAEQTRAALDTALTADLGASEQGTYRLLVRHISADKVEVKLLTEPQTVVIERILESRDCESLAEAIAIVVRAHFLELGIQQREEEKRLEAAATQRSEDAESPSVSKETTPAKVQSLKEDRNPSSWFLFGGAGGALLLPGANPATEGSVGVGLSWTHLRARAWGHSALPYRTGSGQDEIRRIPAGLLVGLSYSTTGKLGLEGGLAAGLGVAWLAPTSTSDPRRAVAASPEVMADLKCALAYAPRVRPWLGTSVRYSVIREEYEISPRGVVGRGPSLMAILSLGVDWTLAPRR